jgi:hypothetical protein
VFHLLNLFFDILLLRKGPQALPASRFLLGSSLTLHFGLGIILYAYSLPLSQAIGAALVGTTLVVALVQAALMVRSLPSRLTQTALALTGTEILLGLVMLPLMVWEAGGGNQPLISVVMLMMLGWQFAVNAHIFRHALDTTTSLGFVSSLVYFLISFFVTRLLTGTGV